MEPYAYGWDDNLLYRRFLLYLRGHALSIFKRELDKIDIKPWEQFQKRFISIFHPLEEEMLWMKRFYDRKANPGEPLEVLAVDLKRLLALPAKLVENLQASALVMKFNDLLCKARLITIETGLVQPGERPLPNREDSRSMNVLALTHDL